MTSLEDIMGNLTVVRILTRATTDSAPFEIKKAFFPKLRLARYFRSKSIFLLVADIIYEDYI